MLTQYKPNDIAKSYKWPTCQMSKTVRGGRLGVYREHLYYTIDECTFDIANNTLFIFHYTTRPINMNVEAI